MEQEEEDFYRERDKKIRQEEIKINEEIEMENLDKDLEKELYIMVRMLSEKFEAQKSILEANPQFNAHWQGNINICQEKIFEFEIEVKNEFQRIEARSFNMVFSYFKRNAEEIFRRIIVLPKNPFE
jgi:hypothetical protein